VSSPSLLLFSQQAAQPLLHSNAAAIWMTLIAKSMMTATGWNSFIGVL
jgi:hypothetical protein